MIRVIALRRWVVFFLALFVLASPALAGSVATGAEPAGLVSRLVEWLSDLWGGASPASEAPDGGCLLDPSGGCHGAAAPPPGCGAEGGAGCGESS